MFFVAELKKLKSLNKISTTTTQKPWGYLPCGDCAVETELIPKGFKRVKSKCDHHRHSEILCLLCVPSPHHRLSVLSTDLEPEGPVAVVRSGGDSKIICFPLCKGVGKINSWRKQSIKRVLRNISHQFISLTCTDFSLCLLKGAEQCLSLLYCGRF